MRREGWVHDHLALQSLTLQFLGMFNRGERGALRGRIIEQNSMSGGNHSPSVNVNRLAGRGL